MANTKPWDQLTPEQQKSLIKRNNRGSTDPSLTSETAKWFNGQYGVRKNKNIDPQLYSSIMLETYDPTRDSYAAWNLLSNKAKKNYSGYEDFSKMGASQMMADITGNPMMGQQAGYGTGNVNWMPPSPITTSAPYNPFAGAGVSNNSPLITGFMNVGGVRTAGGGMPTPQQLQTVQSVYGPTGMTTGSGGAWNPPTGQTNPAAQIPTSLLSQNVQNQATQQAQQPTSQPLGTFQSQGGLFGQSAIAAEDTGKVPSWMDNIYNTKQSGSTIPSWKQLFG